MNRVALITGGSRGIGRGIALDLAAMGWDLVVNYANNQAAAEDTAKTSIECAKAAGHKIRAEICRGNVGQAADRDQLISFVQIQFGRLDLLVNNAGITSIGRSDILDASEENWDALMAINLKGPFFLSQLAGGWMIEQYKEDDSRRGKIINISSISSHTVSSNRGDYCVAKAGLRMVTKLFAARLADSAINVYEVCPGVITSDMTDPVKSKYDKMISDGLTPIRRWGEPSDVGKAVVALANDYFPFTTGDVFNVDGGFTVRQI
ncbi:MAG: 3-ketoacyl-ACP reductase [Verrucomicrobiota bacterium]|nr:3-ketoacyl-ACP reductase [Verrucomicrobiota bacterium]